MNEFGIKPDEIGVGKKIRKPSGKSGPVAANYRGPNGET